MSTHHNIVRCPLDLFHQLESATKAEEMMSRALAAIEKGEIGLAEKELEQACNECRMARFRRAMLIDMIISWGSSGVKLKKLGHDGLGDDCVNVAVQLSSRLDKGEFFKDAVDA